MENKEKLVGPVFLDFEPLSCSMTATHSRDPSEQASNSLVMQLCVVNGEVRTPEDKSLTNIIWTMTFYENGSGNEFAELHNAVGLMNYHEPYRSEYSDIIDDVPEACHAWINLPAPSFAALRGMALDGKLPARLRVSVYGIKYGWEPDGSEKEGDVVAHPNAPISRVEIEVTLVKLPQVEQDEVQVESLWIEPKPDSPELLTTRAMAKAIEQVHARLGWVVGLLAAVVAIVILR